MKSATGGTAGSRSTDRPSDQERGSGSPAEKRARRDLFFRIRVTVLSLVLAGVVLFAWRDVRSRRERNRWQRPLSVSIVLLRRGRIAGAAAEAFRDRVPALEERLAKEYARYRTDGVRPFLFTYVGPVDDPEGPPHATSEGLLAAAEHSWALSRWTSRVDRAAGLDRSVFDSCVYVSASPPKDTRREMVEGESEEGGRVGTVEVELDASMADFALFVAAHELLHTLGASDKYDATGGTTVPGGLVEPDRDPPWPQSKADVMARNRPIGPGVEVPPVSLDELGVGPATAREIGWLREPHSP